jgi:hypothetical protein
VTHGPGSVARVLARVLRLPHEGSAVDTYLITTATGDGEHWLRTFDGRPLETRQRARHDGQIVERFHHLEFTFHRNTVGGATRFHQLAAALVIGPLRIRLPARCAPQVIAREEAAGPRRLHVDVRVELPIIGPLLSYDGTIDVEAAS